MSMADVVGSMGLTLFCNRCVEVFYKFQQNKVEPEELKATCDSARGAFESFRPPKQSQTSVDDKCNLFNTSEEVMSFARAAKSTNGSAGETLDMLIKDLESVSNQDAELEERKKAAKKLQDFFDVLGDYSFGTTRECVRKNLATREA